MELIKELSIDTIKRMPDDCTFDDIMYELNFISKVTEGITDSEEGRVFSTEEVLMKVDQWAKSNGLIEL
jgi:predicted transcriptional regulator